MYVVLCTDAQSRMQGVPEELKAPLVANDDTEEAAHPYDVLRRKEIQFESYAMFVQVRYWLTYKHVREVAYTSFCLYIHAHVICLMIYKMVKPQVDCENI